tara:strand:+ start:497 stop:1504 length:1008 start_codon:yes stop_codon:yes gene_type:complete
MSSTNSQSANSSNDIWECTYCTAHNDNHICYCIVCDNPRVVCNNRKKGTEELFQAYFNEIRRGHCGDTLKIMISLINDLESVPFKTVKPLLTFMQQQIVKQTQIKREREQMCEELISQNRAMITICNRYNDENKYKTVCHRRLQKKHHIMKKTMAIVNKELLHKDKIIEKTEKCLTGLDKNPNTTLLCHQRSSSLTDITRKSCGLFAKCHTCSICYDSIRPCQLVTCSNAKCGVTTHLHCTVSGINSSTQEKETDKMCCPFCKSSFKNSIIQRIKDSPVYCLDTEEMYKDEDEMDIIEILTVIENEEESPEEIQSSSQTPSLGNQIAHMFDELSV